MCNWTRLRERFELRSLCTSWQGSLVRKDRWGCLLSRPCQAGLHCNYTHFYAFRYELRAYMLFTIPAMKATPSRRVHVSPPQLDDLASLVGPKQRAGCEVEQWKVGLQTTVIRSNWVEMKTERRRLVADRSIE